MLHTEMKLHSLGRDKSLPIFFIGDNMIKNLFLDLIFVVRTTLYMCNVVQYNNNFRSLRKR